MNAKELIERVVEGEDPGTTLLEGGGYKAELNKLADQVLAVSKRIAPRNDLTSNQESTLNDMGVAVKKLRLAASKLGSLK